MVFPASSKDIMLASVNSGALVYEHIITEINTSSIPISDFKKVLVRPI